MLSINDKLYPDILSSRRSFSLRNIKKKERKPLDVAGRRVFIKDDVCSSAIQLLNLDHVKG